MKYFSTNNKKHLVDFRSAVLKGLADDQGLYLPESIPQFPESFFSEANRKSFRELSFEVANAFLKDDFTREELMAIIEHTLIFDAPLKSVEENIFAFELFHGPTLAFKDFGARFLSAVMSHYAQQLNREITVLVATSGDTGGAVASGFYNVNGTRVVVLYPKGRVSALQEMQFASLGGNIHAIEINGSFDDCQRVVKQAFLDRDLTSKLFLTSANSINIARLIPQMFYYFRAYAQIKTDRPIVVSVPSGNFGNLTAGVMAKRMGLPVHKFIAATNQNDIVPEFLSTGLFKARPSVTTISNAMDVGSPSNFARLNSLYHEELESFRSEITGYSFSDKETRDVMISVFREDAYMLDPHGAVGYLGLKNYMDKNPDCTGVFLETAHPSKFKEVVDDVLGIDCEIPERLSRLLARQKKCTPLSDRFESLKEYLLSL